MSTAEVCTEVGKFYARTLDQSKMFATVIIKTTVEPQSCPWLLLPYSLAFPGSSDGKESACQCGRTGFKPWVRKIPWRRAWQPTPEFLPGESHGWRNLADCSPQGRKSQTRLKQLSMAWHKFILQFILKSAGPRITKTIF